MHGDIVELYFFCPVIRDVFRTDRWEVSGCETVSLDHAGNKRLQGTVTVACPLCGEEHVYSPDELPCPLVVGVGEPKEM